MSSAADSAEGLTPADIYQVQQCLGSGSFGGSFKAVRKEDGETVALKMYVVVWAVAQWPWAVEQ
jgi:hypothetical protein